MHTIEIDKAGKAGVSGQRYNATWNGEVIVSRSKDPEFDACRELLARDVTGQLVTRHAGTKTIGLIIDIERGAALAIVEGAISGPRLCKWRPHPHSKHAFPVLVSEQGSTENEFSPAPTGQIKMAA